MSEVHFRSKIDVQGKPAEREQDGEMQSGGVAKLGLHIVCWMSI